MEEKVIKIITANPRELRKMFASLTEDECTSLIDAVLVASENINAILGAYIDEAEADHDNE